MTFTDRKSQLTVPHNLESLMWIFPTGCYDICPKEGYIVGPRGEYDYHEWQLFSNSQQSGNGFIYPYWPNQPGSYQLMINDGTCSYTSGTMTLNPDPDKCGFEYYCEIKAHIEYVKQTDGPYLVFGVIHNFGSNSLTLNLTSGNNSGFSLNGFNYFLSCKSFEISHYFRKKIFSVCSAK